MRSFVGCRVSRTPGHLQEDLIHATGTYRARPSASPRSSPFQSHFHIGRLLALAAHVRGPMTNVREFASFKAEGRKISIVTAYDAWSAHIVARLHVDAILVGDS